MSEYQKQKWYYFKFNKDFFQNYKIRILKKMPNGTEYALLLLQLMAESVSHRGELRFSDEIPYTDEMISAITDTNIDTVRNGLKVLQDLQLIEIKEDFTIVIPQMANLIGSETNMASIMRERRKITKDNKEITMLSRDKRLELRVKILDITDVVNNTNNIYRTNINNYIDVLIDNVYINNSNIREFEDYFNETLKEDNLIVYDYAIHKALEVISSTEKHISNNFQYFKSLVTRFATDFLIENQ